MTADRKRNVAERKAQGAHYTPAALATFVAEQIADVFPVNGRSGPLAILDPAAGDGSLLSAMLRVLAKQGVPDVEAVGLDTSRSAVAAATSTLADISDQGDRVQVFEQDFLDTVDQSAGLQVRMFEVAGPALGTFDIVIANPPYVRTQVMGAQRSKQLAGAFALSGRIDLYFAFVRAISRVLRPGGIAGLIVSNRFMTTQSGASLRRSIPEDFEVLRVFDFGDTRLFEAAVLPAVLLLRRKSDSLRRAISAPYASIYSTASQGDEARATSVFDAIRRAGRICLDSGDAFEVKQGYLDVGNSSDSVWRLATEQSDAWLARIATRASLSFGDISPLRVGIKTTSDRIFIRNDWEELSEDLIPEVLRPITTHHAARRFRPISLENSPKILYTHEVRDGKRRPIDLKAYPRTARYLEFHRTALSSRSYLRDSGREWYEIWVPQDPAAWSAPKLVWRDISERPVFWIDTDGAVVNGDCYWLSAPPGQEDLLWLALAVANSTLAEAFYDHRFNNRLYARRRRFITQYVQEFPLPDPHSPSAQKMVRLARKIHDLTPSEEADLLANELDALTWEAFSLCREEGSRQPDLFLTI